MGPKPSSFPRSLNALENHTLKEASSSSSSKHNSQQQDEAVAAATSLLLGLGMRRSDVLILTGSVGAAALPFEENLEKDGSVEPLSQQPSLQQQQQKQPLLSLSSKAPSSLPPRSPQQTSPWGPRAQKARLTNLGASAYKSEVGVGSLLAWQPTATPTVPLAAGEK